MISISAWAQYPELNWAHGIGSTTTDQGVAITSDAAGNVYVTGTFSGTVDFDPRVGVTSLTSSGSLDIFVTKFDVAGNLVWARKIGGPQQDVGLAISVDASSDILLTGYFRATADFDPGSGIANFTSAGEDDIFVCKLNSNGDYQWAYAVGGSSFDRGSSIAVNASSDIVVTGTFRQTVDFDAGPGTTIFTNLGLDDSFIVKLTGSTGSLLWAKQFECQVRGISIDVSNDILSTGAFSGTVDFNPGAAVFPLTGIGNDAFVLKLQDNGDFVWAISMGGNSEDVGQSIKTDAAGNVYTTGYFVRGDGSPHDFDPGAGVFQLTPMPDINSSNSDIYVSKLTAAGNFIWAKQMGGIGMEQPLALALDASANVYTTGTFSGTVDFDPSSSTFSFTANGFSNIYVSKLNSSGDFVWAEKPMGTYAGFGRGITISTANQINITGSFDSTVDFSAGSCDFNLTTNGQSDIFIQKLNQTGVPPPIITSFTPTVGLAGTVVTITGFNFDPVPSNNIVKFNGTLAVVTASTATSITTSVPVGTTTGFITIEIGCASGISSSHYTFSTCVPPAQRNALIELYNSTDGSNWTNSNNWTSIDESTWFGVTVTGCNITEISLPNNNLNGYLPGEIGALTSLQRLDLSNNGLFYGLPTELGNLNSLQFLFLQNNQLDGSVPSELSNLSSLINVSLNNNRFDGVAPAIGLASAALSNVHLENNFFNEMADITGYTNLNSFSIGNNYLSFEDLEPNASVSNFTYSPQAKLPPGGIVSFTVGGALTIPFSTPGTANSYQWYKNGVPVPGATAATLTIPSTVVGDAGTYHVRINNSIATGVTLQSYDYVVVADPCTSAARTAGFIDATFQPNFDNPTNVFGVAIQSTGKIIAAVPSTTVGGVPVFGTVRFNSNGTLDGTFNQIPEQTIPLIQPDDKILGYANNQVIRYNADGTDDFAFNNNAPQSFSSSLYAMALQPDGKIIYSITGYMGTMGISRLNADGTTDFTFANLSYLASAIEVQPDGKILIAAVSGSLNRLNPDGSADASFDAGSPPIHSISDLLVQPDGKIIAVGKFTSVQGSNRFGIVRLNANGSLDATFVAQGIADLATLNGPYRVALMSNGKLIVAGDFSNVNGSNKKNLVRLNSDGTLDCSLDPGLSTNAPIESLALQTNDEILISGDFITYDGTTRNGLARVNNSSPTTCIPAAERAALIALYNATNGVNWTNKNNWLNTDEGTWYGVTVASCHVTELQLPNNNLAGSLPVELGDLPQLKKVILWSNKLTGAIPTSIGNLTALIEIDFNDNQLSGGIPSTLGNITALQKIRLDKNQLSGSIPTSIYNLTNLKTLEFGNNQLTGTISSSVANLANLESLGLSGNQLTGSIPTEIGNMITLKRIILGVNQLTGSLPASIGNLVNLTAFSVFNNQLSGTIPSTFGNVVNLTGLGLSVNQFTGAVPAGLGLIPNLNDVSLRDNDFTSIPTFVSNSFTDLLVYGNKLNFGHLEPNIGKTGFVYAPQDNLPGGVASTCVGSTLTINFSTPGSANSYQWYKNGILIPGATSANFTKANATAADAGNYTVQITNAIVTGLTLNSDNFIVSINPVPAVPSGNPVSTCPGSVATLTATGGTNGQYRWYSVPTGGIATPAQFNSTLVTNPILVNTTFYVALNNGACESARTPILVSTNTSLCPPPVISTASLVLSIGENKTLDLKTLITTLSGTLNVNSIQITVPPPSGAVASILDGVLTIDYKGIAFTGKETLTIRACDTNGNCATQQIELEVAGELVIYNALSPNGANPTFIIQFIDAIPETKNNVVTIFDRWQNQVWRGENYNNTSVVFKGLSEDGSSLPNGTYFYKIEFGSGRKMKTGFISLKR